MARRLDPVTQRLAAKSHILQIVRVTAADGIGWKIERDMREQVGRVKALVQRAAKMSGPWTPKQINWLRESIDEGFAILMDEAQDTYDKSLRDFCVESYDWARKLLMRTLPRWYFRRLAPLALAGEATIDPPNPLTPTKIIIPKKVYEKFVAPALEVQSYVEPVVDADPMTQEEFEAFASEVIFPPLTLSQIETIVENDQWLRTFPGNKSKFNDPAFRDRLVNGIAAGEDVEKLTKSIQDLEAGVYWKARRTARTESLRVAEAAQRETWDDLGGMMAGAQVLAVLDQNTRPEHAQRNGQIYAEEPREGELPMDELPFVPDEPNCALPGQLVGAAVQSASKAWYAGKAIQFTTGTGAVFSVTPNHPVLTQRGFVAARCIQKIDRLFSHDGWQEGPVVVADDEQDTSAMIEEVFRALQDAFPSFDVESSPLNFHGDGVAVEGDINVVLPNVQLVKAGESKSRKGIDNFGFHPASVKAKLVSRGRSLDLGFVGVSAAATAGPCGGDLTINEGGVSLDRGPFESFLFGLGAQDNAVFSQHATDGKAGYAALASELIDRLAGGVTSCEIVDIREIDFCGHVYDLETPGGWYYLNGVIVHNCRCWTVPVLVPPDDVADDPAFTAIFQNTEGANIPDPAAYDKWFDQADDGQRRLAAGTRRYNDMAQRLGGVRNPEWTDFVDPETGSLLSRNQLQRETDAEREDRKRANVELFRRREAMLKEVAARGYLSR